MSVEGIGRPIVPLKSSTSSGLQATIRRGLGEAVAFDQRLAGRLPSSARPRPAAAPFRRQPRARGARNRACRNSWSLSSALNSVLTPVMKVKGVSCNALTKAGDVARIGDQQVVRADHDRHEAVHLEREHVIERQRRDEGLAFAPIAGREPGVRLLQIGDDVAVRQHRALGHAGRAPGILEEGDVGRLTAHRGNPRPATAPAGGPVERTRLRQAPGRNRAADMAQDEIGHHPACRRLSRSPTPVTMTTRTRVPAIAFSSVWAKFSSTTIASAPESSS